MKKSLLLILAFTAILICVGYSVKGGTSQDITKEQAKALVEETLKIWNDFDLALIAKVFAPDCVLNDPMYPEPMKGTDALKATLSGERKAMPDLKVKIEDVYVKGDKVVMVWTLAATHAGPLEMPEGTIPATGNKIKSSGVNICRMAAGKVTEVWFFYNPLDVFLPMGFTFNPPKSP